MWSFSTRNISSTLSIRTRTWVSQRLKFSSLFLVLLCLSSLSQCESFLLLIFFASLTILKKKTSFFRIVIESKCFSVLLSTDMILFNKIVISQMNKQEESAMKTKWRWKIAKFFPKKKNRDIYTERQTFHSIPYFFFVSSTHIENIQTLAPQTRQKSIVEVSVDRGNKVHLPCNVQGNPVPSITWYRLSNSGSYYPTPPTHRIIPSQSLLYIRNADERDAGRWVSFRNKIWSHLVYYFTWFP